MARTWTDTDARQLQSLREQAGTDQAGFARRHSLSTAQVRELEGEGRGAFYSEAIKAHTGRRLLAALGAEPVADTDTDDTARDPAAPASLPPPAAVATPTKTLPAIPVPLPAAQRRLRRTVPMALALTVVASAGAGLILSHREQPARAVPAAARPATPPSTDVPSSPLATPAATAAVPAPDLAASPPPGPAALATAGAAVWPAGCEMPGLQEATTYRSPVANRPPTYVYLESLEEARVCVLDGSNQVRVASLKAGESLNVPGVAPFTVRSAQWGGLRVFFQGLRVQLEPGAPSGTVVILPWQGT